MAFNMKIANLDAYAADMTKVLQSCKEMGDNLKVIQKYLANVAALKVVAGETKSHPRYQHLPTPFANVQIPYPLNKPITTLTNTPVQPLQNTPVQPVLNTPRQNTPVQPLQTNTPVLNTHNTEPMTYQDAVNVMKSAHISLSAYGYKIGGDYSSRYNAIQKVLKNSSIYEVLQKLRALIIIWKAKKGATAEKYLTNLEMDFAVLQTQSHTTPPPTPELVRTQKIRQENPPPLKRPHLHTISLDFYGYNPQNNFNERMAALNKAVGDHGKANVEFSLMSKMNTTVAPLKWEEHNALRKAMDTMECDYYAIAK